MGLKFSHPGLCISLSVLFLMSTWTKLKPENVLIWSGAGISMDAPSNIPSGEGFSKRAITEFMLPSTYTKVEKLYESLKSEIFRGNKEQKFPRLETVLTALVNAYTNDVLRDVLSDVKNASPNINHKFFGKHLDAGGVHVTANYDTCTERCASTVANDSSHQIVHYHGKYEDEMDISGLGTTLPSISNGLSPNTTGKLLSLLTSKAITTIFFVGYSGTDYFDITPFFMENLQILKDKKIIWHRETEKDRNSETLNLANLLVRKNISIEFLDQKLESILPEISSAWSIPLEKVDTESPPWKRVTFVSDSERKDASLALFNRIGFRKEFLELHREVEPKDSQDWEDWGDALWAQGSYLHARDKFRRGFCYEKIRSDFFETRILWIRGDLLKAQRRAWKLVEEIENPIYSEMETLESFIDLKAKILILYGKVLLFLKRTPDCYLLFRFLKERRIEAIRRLEDFYPSVLGSSADDLGVDYGDLLRALKNEKNSKTFQDILERFGQKEAIHATLNYQVGALRNRFESPTQNYPHPSKREFEDLRHDQIEIGAKGEALLGMLLPGARVHFSFEDFKETINPIQITPWHRFRLTCGFLLLSKWDRFRQVRESSLDA